MLRGREKLFVDVHKAWQRVKSPEDQKEMQRDQSTLQKWSVKWLLELNVKKCKQFSGWKSTESQYYIGDEANKKNLQLVVQERDLGVVFSSELKWGTQCQKVAGKAMSVLGMIKI